MGRGNVVVLTPRRRRFLRRFAVASATGHFTPESLAHELIEFRRLRGYLPRTIIVHVDPAAEKEIEAEIGAVGSSLGSGITLAREGMELEV